LNEIDCLKKCWLNYGVTGKDALMQTIKTFVVVALLLTVCYGAYKAMNAPDVEMPEDLKTWADQNGKDVLPDFEIPAITSNDTFGIPSNEKLTGATNDSAMPQFPVIDIGSPILTSNPSSTAPSNSNASNSIELPKLPAMSSSLSAAPTLGSPALPSLNPNTSPAANVPPASNAPSAIGSVPNLSLPQSSPATSLAADAAGPAIPFNPSLPSFPADNIASSASSSFPASGASLSADAASSLANDLIDAGTGGLGSMPLLETQQPSSAIEAGSTLTSLTNPPALDSVGQSFASPSSASPGAAVQASAERSPQPTQPYSVAKAEALQIASQGKLREALELMSQYYESPDLGYAEHTDLVDMLDALTREVIYSDRHLLASPYTVSAQDTLQSLATQYQLNPEFLAAMNKMGSSQALVPNTQIKVVEGPFHAQVSLSRGELTLFLRKLYAGRFPVSISQKNRPPQARYEIVDRRQDRTFYGANVRIPADDPTNPYGGFWLSLGSDYSIHGSPEQVTSDLENSGCISLAPLDASDVYRILGKGSAVEIKP
jgi:lipoprotein-anchoring transpeptidase ErfK/SrfK